MKKVLLLIISLILLAPAVFAYQTVLVNFPPYQGWHKALYEVQGSEAILQYTPSGQTSKKWTRTLIFHSYKDPRIDSMQRFSEGIMGQMEYLNASAGFKYIKNDDTDSIAVRCVSKVGKYPAQCEIFRTSNSFEGFITMQYINKNVADFKKNYNTWLNIVRNIRIYYSYYMDERVLNKETSFHI